VVPGLSARAGSCVNRYGAPTYHRPFRSGSGARPRASRAVKSHPQQPRLKSRPIPYRYPRRARSTLSRLGPAFTLAADFPVFSPRTEPPSPVLLSASRGLLDHRRLVLSSLGLSMCKRLAADRASFIEPCLPSPADKPPSGSNSRDQARRLPAHGQTRPGGYPADHRLDAALSASGRGGEPPQGAVLPDRRPRWCAATSEGWPPFSCSAIAGTSPRHSSTPSTCWNSTAKTCAASRLRCARRRWPAFDGRAGTAFA
jgi:hypothetical protein